MENTRQAGYESTVGLTRNAKGITQIDVVVRNADPNEAYRTARSLYGALAQLYPYPESNGNA
jgi:hypothetical protein